MQSTAPSLIETPFPQAYSEKLRSLLLMCEVVGYTVVWTDPTWHVMRLPGNRLGYLEASNNAHGALFLARQLELRNATPEPRSPYKFGPSITGRTHTHIIQDEAETVSGSLYSTISFPAGAVYTVPPPQKPPY